MLTGVELVGDREHLVEGREALVELLARDGQRRRDHHDVPVHEEVEASLERGLYPFVHWNVFTIVPPLTITRDELDEGLEILDDVLAIADEYYSA